MQAPLVQKRAVLTVPDLENQAFVDAKISLQDAGFAWRVVGSVRGYPANTVVTQIPAAGTQVYDTGAPVVRLTLSHDRGYPQLGSPQDASPYRGTAVEPAEPLSRPLRIAPSSSSAPQTTTTPAPAPSAATPATTRPAATVTTPTPGSSADRATAGKHAAKAHYPQSRPPAFSVAGAPKEPLDEMPLTDRARALGRWLARHRQPTNATVKHWLYQNEWIVTGARFGWWHGAQALRILIKVDRRAQALWGVGSKSEAVAAGALAEVEARSK